MSHSKIVILSSTICGISLLLLVGIFWSIKDDTIVRNTTQSLLSNTVGTKKITVSCGTEIGECESGILTKDNQNTSCGSIRAWKCLSLDETLSIACIKTNLPCNK